jgi:tRNA1Val (adenine37-N6)-methyltransferase
MSQYPFHFKQFKVDQDYCAMKIGTDGVLLGAWASINHHPQSILDIGAGTGIIALQLAQRCDAKTIDAIEIDEDAHEQSTHNFEQSSWGDRLFCYHASAQEFASEIEDKYDLIVSNPPFFEAPKVLNLQKEKNKESRAIARFTDTLPFQHLVVCVAHLLSETGIFATVLPEQETASFIEIAKSSNLFLRRICRVRGTQTAPVKRCLLEFSFKQTKISSEELTIEVSRHEYTEAYKNLVQDFYLKM